MISLLRFHEFHGTQSEVLVNVDEISSVEEAQFNTSVVTLKNGKSWRFRETVADIAKSVVSAVN